VIADSRLNRIVSLLEKSGYRVLDSPLAVGSARFDFAVALVGTEHRPDLIVVIDSVEETEIRIRQKLEALSRALDLAGSRRPLTAILVGPRPSQPTLEAIARVCRVLPVGTVSGSDANQTIHDWLAVLLPIELPSATGSLADSLSELARHAPEVIGQPLASELISAANSGADAVRDLLRTWISDSVNSPEGEGS
jgi:hypothetical protein